MTRLRKNNEIDLKDGVSGVWQLEVISKDLYC